MKNKYHNIDEFLMSIAPLRELYIRGKDKRWDELIEDAAERELTQDELQMASAARAEIKLPEYLKRKK